MDSKGVRRCGWLGLTAALALGCGSEPQSPTPSGTAMDAPAATVPSAPPVVVGGNHPPVIGSVRLQPAVPLSDEPLQAVVSASDPDGDAVELGFLWQVNGRRIPGGGPNVVLPTLARGDRVSVRVTASDGRAQSEPAIVEAAAGNHAPRVLDVIIHTRTGDGEGSRWVVDPVAEDPDGDTLEYTYVWTDARGKELGRGREMSREGWKRGDQLRVTILADDGQARSVPVASAPIEIGNSPPDILSRPPGLDASGRFRYEIEARDPDGDRRLRYSLGASPDGMEIDTLSGVVTWQASLANEGEHRVEVVVDDQNGGTTRQSFFVVVRAAPGGPPAAPR